MNNLIFTTDLKQYLPAWYKSVSDYQEIMDTESTDFDTLKNDVLRVYGNLFFSTMDIQAVEQWELLLGIIPDPSDTLEFRRTRVLNRVSMKPPYTERFLQDKLDELIGPGKYTMVVDVQNFTLTIETAASDQSFATEVLYTINRVKPAHILYINRPALYDTILESEKIEKIQNEWNYILGSWVLGFAPFVGGSTSEVIKVAATPSIQDRFLNAIATFSMGDISSARLNGSIVKSTLTKAQSGSTFTVSYVVTPSDTNQISKIELLDANSQVLTSISLYVPVSQVTDIKHTFYTKEGTNGN